MSQYNVNKVGVYGSGGEYSVMQGYGPTNGAVLRILEIFPRLQSPQTNDVWSVDEHDDQNQNDLTKNDRSRAEDRHTALKLSSPVNEQAAVVVPAATDTLAPYTTAKMPPKKATFADKPVVVTEASTEEAEEVTRRTIPVQRVRMVAATTAAPPADKAPVRLSKNVRDDRKNCQSTLTFSISALLISVISTMLFM